MPDAQLPDSRLRLLAGTKLLAQPVIPEPGQISVSAIYRECRPYSAKGVERLLMVTKLILPCQRQHAPLDGYARPWRAQSFRTGYRSYAFRDITGSAAYELLSVY